MREVPPTPTTPVGFLNQLTWFGMIAASLGGTILCFSSFCLSWEAIRDSGVRIMNHPERSYYNQAANFDNPGKPWLCFAFLILACAFLLEARRAYKVAKRKKSACDSAAIITKVTAAGGVMLFAGAESRSGLLLLGLFVMAYAGIGYLAYAHWERVRAQLYKD